MPLQTPFDNFDRSLCSLASLSLLSLSLSLLSLSLPAPNSPPPPAIASVATSAIAARTRLLVRAIFLRFPARRKARAGSRN